MNYVLLSVIATLKLIEHVMKDVIKLPHKFNMILGSEIILGIKIISIAGNDLFNELNDKDDTDA